jgi:hypothetical protein
MKAGGKQSNGLFIPQDGTLHTLHCKNLRSYIYLIFGNQPCLTLLIMTFVSFLTFSSPSGIYHEKSCPFNNAVKFVFYPAWQEYKGFL